MLNTSKEPLERWVEWRFQTLLRMLFFALYLSTAIQIHYLALPSNLNKFPI